MNIIDKLSQKYDIDTRIGLSNHISSFLFGEIFIERLRFDDKISKITKNIYKLEKKYGFDKDKRYMILKKKKMLKNYPKYNKFQNRINDRNLLVHKKLVTEIYNFDLINKTQYEKFIKKIQPLPFKIYGNPILPNEKFM